MKKVFRKFICILLLVTILMVATSCSNEENVSFTTPEGYSIQPGVWNKMIASNIEFGYFISEQSDESFIADVRKAEELVRAWWGNDETFVAPTAVLPTSFASETDLKGLDLDAGYLLIDPNRPDRLDTMVHEIVHLQREGALLYNDNTGVQLLEMVVEKITKDIVGKISEPTENLVFYQACPNLYKYSDMLEEAFRAGMKGEEIFPKIWGKDAKKIVAILDTYQSLPMFFHSEEEYELFIKNVLGTTPVQLQKAVIG